MSYKPEVRRDELTIREVGQELVVYDSRHRRVHCLNKTAAPILEASDGTRTVDELAFLFSHDLDIAERTKLVWVTLQDLSRADLLTTAIAPPRDLERSRRNLLRKAAVIGLAFPVIESIIAQSAKAHASARRGDNWHESQWRDWDRRWEERRDRWADRLNDGPRLRPN